MISYVNNNGHCLRLGGEATQTNNDATGAGVQICFGYFAKSSIECSTKLNDTNTVYTGAGDNLVTYANTFASAPLAVATPFTGKYWFSDLLSEKGKLTHVDLLTSKSGSVSSCGGNYIAIGKYGADNVSDADAAQALTAAKVTAYWNEASNAVRIPIPDKDFAVQILTGSFSGVGTYSKLNSALYRASISMSKTFSQAFTSAPVIVAAPSMQCRAWGKPTTFAHPYWFGGVNADQTHIKELNVYSNTALASQTSYARYIAFGLSSASVNTTDGWRAVSVSLEYDTTTKAYALRFGDDAGGMQLAFGNFGFGDREIFTTLNGVDSTIYTAFKKAPAYNASDRKAGAQKMYFPRAFCESPSTMVMMSNAVDAPTFKNSHWFGDAASDAVSMFNVDFYTNKKFNSLRNVQGKYLAVGRYSAKSDWARDFILKALSYKGSDTVDSKKIKPYFLDRYDEIFNHTRKSNNGWCSEFASVVLHEAMQAPIKEYPYSTYVKGFIQQFSYPDPERPAYDDKKVSSSTSKFYLGTYDQKNKTTAFHVGKIDSSYNENTYYSYGGTTDAGNDLHFSCTELGIKDVTPQIGDLIFFGHSNTCHTAIVINVNGSHIFTVEGNVDEKHLNIGTSTKNTVLHARRKISAESSDTNKDRVVGIGDVYACHAALKAKLNASKG